MNNQFNSLRLKAESVLNHRKDSHGEDSSSDELEQLLHDLNVHQIELELQNEELIEAQSKLKSSHEKYAELYHAAPIGYCSVNENGIIIDCNIALQDLLKVGRDSLVKHTLIKHILSSDIPIFKHMILANENREHYQIRLLDALNNTITCQVSTYKIKDKVDFLGDIWLLTITNISQLLATKFELEVKSKALESTQEAVMITSKDMKICYVNKGFEKTTGYAYQEVKDRTPSILKSGRHKDDFYREMWVSIAKQGFWRGEIWNRRANGEVYPEWLSISAIYDDYKRPLYYIGVFSDISKEEEARKRLHNLAYYDGITSLPNRYLFNDRLKQELHHSSRYTKVFAVLFMDLDRFKMINDSLGHSVGDELLVQVANRLSDVLREVDTVARMGGDEFVVLLPDLHEKNDAKLVADKILTTMAKAFILANSQYHISISIGISYYPDDGLDDETLIKHADIAMYQAKESGRNNQVQFQSSAQNKIDEKIVIEHELRDALNHDKLELYYQPKYHVDSLQCIGVEALIRWKHPQKGMIPPLTFLPIAEESGLIINIGNWVLRTAAKQYQIWKQQGLDIGIISVNLSPQQFLQSDLVKRIQTILKETKMPAQYLGIEVTESTAMPNYNYSVNVLGQLRELGIKISIDDFGTGFSSLSHLKKLPIDVIKIDREFITDIPENSDDVAITKAIIAMAKHLNLKIVAEGVETQEQLNFIREHGCDELQGFLISKPLAPDALSVTLNLSNN